MPETRIPSSAREGPTFQSDAFEPGVHHSVPEKANALAEQLQRGPRRTMRLSSSDETVPAGAEFVAMQIRSDRRWDALLKDPFLRENASLLCRQVSGEVVAVFSLGRPIRNAIELAAITPALSLRLNGHARNTLVTELIAAAENMVIVFGNNQGVEEIDRLIEFGEQFQQSDRGSDGDVRRQSRIHASCRLILPTLSTLEFGNGRHLHQ